MLWFFFGPFADVFSATLIAIVANGGQLGGEFNVGADSRTLQGVTHGADGSGRAEITRRLPSNQQLAHGQQLQAPQCDERPVEFQAE